MKKLLLATVFTIIGATAANAQVNVGINVGEPAYAYPVYETPRPIYYSEVRRDRPRDYDWNYWQPREDHDNGEHRGWDKDHDHGRGNDRHDDDHHYDHHR